MSIKHRKECFAHNLDRLLSIIGLNRAKGAEEIGVSYRLLRRIVTAGIGRIVARNRASLEKIATYFCLTDPDMLWNVTLLDQLLVPDHPFVLKFQTRLAAAREKRLQALSPQRIRELHLLNLALGFTNEPPPLVTEEAQKVAEILTSSKAETFLRIIDDYYEFSQRPTP